MGRRRSGDADGQQGAVIGGHDRGGENDDGERDGGCGGDDTAAESLEFEHYRVPFCWFGETVPPMNTPLQKPCQFRETMKNRRN